MRPEKLLEIGRKLLWSKWQESGDELASVAIASLMDAGMLVEPGGAEELTRRRAQVVHLDGLLTLASTLEIPRPGNRLPLLLQRVIGSADRWYISDREGRRWHRLVGWVFEPGGLTADEHMRDDARYTLAEAVPLAQRIAAGDLPTVPEPPQGASEIKHPAIRRTRAHFAENPLPEQRQGGAA
jgi:hypothetical protein